MFGIELKKRQKEKNVSKTSDRLGYAVADNFTKKVYEKTLKGKKLKL